jgi:putative colanic acid biosynthesis UDP-glucose lipid carrier transferase
MPRKGFIQDNINQFSVFSRVFDLILIQLIFYVCLWFMEASYNDLYLIVSLISIVAYALFSENIQLYRFWPSNTLLLQSIYTLISWIMAICAVSVFLFFTKTGANVSRLLIGFWLLITGFTLITWRLLFRIVLFYLHKSIIETQRVAIIGLTDSGIALAKELINHPECGYKLRSFFDDRESDRLPILFSNKLDGKVDVGINLAKEGKFDVVYIALPMIAENRIDDILHLLGNTTVDVRILPNALAYSLLDAKRTSIGEVNALSINESPLTGSVSFVKRLEDIIGSLAILSLISIPMLIIALFIKLDSPGKIIFKQKRYGLDGKAFNVWKFRTMNVSENGSVVKQACKNDPRVTRLGNMLRRTSLDELPQFFNVLKGTMSIVGPRPHAAAHNEEYRTAVDFYMFRHKVKPGITGWAQINGWRGETDTLIKMEKRVQYDLEYIRNWTFLFDMKIILLTVILGFTDKNAL